MKLPFSIFNCQLPIARRVAKGMGIHSQSRRGIALVITLIMISVTLVMAVAFLALARRERVSVSTTTDAASAKLAADSALAAAQAQILANVFLTNANLYNYGLFVSTNYQNSYGFVRNVSSPTNVNYDYLSIGGALSSADLIQNIANLQFLPRAPVYIVTNTQTGGSDFRFYLDLNRNGQFDTNGFVTDFDSAGNSIGTSWQVGDPEWVGVLARPDTTHSANNQFVARYAFIAIPIGNALDINAIYDQTRNPGLNSGQDGYFRNEGVGSWELNLAAFLTDLNTNQWDPLADRYTYGEPFGNFNTGRGFEDAFALLTNRYDSLYISQAVPASPLYNALIYSNIDGYTFGNLMTSNNLPPTLLPSSPSWAGSVNTNRYFDLPDELFGLVAPHASAGVAVGFTNSLALAGSSLDTYDRYTYYRMLAQMGTDSDPDDGQMNLNYSNVLVSYNVNGYVTNISNVIPGAETNAVPWRPLDFFLAASDRLLRAYTTNWFASNPSNYLAAYYNITYSDAYTNAYGQKVLNDPTGFGLTNVPFVGMTNQIPVFGVTNIPVYINGQFVYSPAVNRLLQLAANMYDASTTNFFPSVFRPTFFVTNQYGYTNVYINGYQFVSTLNNGAKDPRLSTPINVQNLPYGSTTVTYSGSDGVNVYGVPWIIGAKKGFPNFNKFGMQNDVQIWRRLQIARNAPVSAGFSVNNFVITNQLYEFTISNTIGIDCWNSYTNQYPYPIFISAQDVLSMWITNSYFAGAPRYITNDTLTGSMVVPQWPAYVPVTTAGTASFAIPLEQTVTLLTNSIFYFGSSPPGTTGFWPESYNLGWETNRGTFDVPQFGLLTTNQLRLYMMDMGSSGTGPFHIIDYVQLGGPVSSQNLNSEFQTNSGAQGYGNMWATNTYNSGVPYGIMNQLQVSENLIPLNSTYWQNQPGGGVSLNTAQAEIDGFCQFLGLGSPYPGAAAGNPNGEYYLSNSVVQVPYTPQVTISDYVTYQANDPLVHYLASDLNYSGPENGSSLVTGVTVNQENQNTVVPPSYSTVNIRYQPWGMKSAMPTGNSPINTSGYETNPADMAFKDPSVWGSYNWDFPTNKYPTVGWLGRVHRGTPWQTVYLKANNILKDTAFGPATGTNTWAFWTGDMQLTYGQYFDAPNSAPLQDRMLFDLFTTRFNDNAALGTLSVNQTNLAAWSAVFSGVVALTNMNAWPIKYTVGLVNPPTITTVINNGWLNIQPAGIGGMTNSVLGMLITNIDSMRASYPNGAFMHVGDILSAATLTEQSPFLNWTNANQFNYGLDDEAYEWLPQQTLGLLRSPSSPNASAPRYLIYCYGQALRPAPNSLVLENGENQFGLCTNYQVVAESAVRAIVSVQPQVQIITSGAGTGPVTNYTTKVESYSVLPPN